MYASPGSRPQRPCRSFRLGLRRMLAARSANSRQLDLYLFGPPTDEVVRTLGAGAFGKVVECIDKDK